MLNADLLKLSKSENSYKLFNLIDLLIHSMDYEEGFLGNY